MGQQRMVGRRMVIERRMESQVDQHWKPAVSMVMEPSCEARSLHGDGAVVPLTGQRLLHTARSLHGDGDVVLPVLSGV